MRRISFFEEMRVPVTIVLLVLLLVPLAFGHLAGGEDKIVNGYQFDFGFDPEKLYAQEGTVLSFTLSNATSGETVNTDGCVK